MKTAGSILSALFDEGFMKKAHGYSKFYNSWKDITEKNGIAAAGDHSRIKDFDKGIVIIEIDHPGWKQILQTKQSKLLNDFRYRFPDLNIEGLSLMLGSGEPQVIPKGAENLDKIEERTNVTTKEKQIPANKGIEEIKDENFKEKLKKLSEIIAENET